MTINKISINLNKTKKCVETHCKLSDKEIADNHKLLLEHRECIKKAITQKRDKQLSYIIKCKKSNKYTKKRDKLIKCSTKKCNIEINELSSIMSKLFEESAKLQKTLDNVLILIVLYL